MMSRISALAVVVATAGFNSVAAGQSLPYTGEHMGYAYPLKTPNSYGCVPGDINDSGQIVGFNFVNNVGSRTLAFLTGPNGEGVRNLGLSGPNSSASGINSHGQVVGYGYASQKKAFAFITDPDGSHFRPAVPELPGALVADINDAGQMTGTIILNSHYAAFLTGPAGVGYTLLPNLGGVSSQGVRVNALGEVGGLSTVAADGDSNNTTHAYITGPNGVGVTALMLPDANVSTIGAINDFGQVTGTQWFGNLGMRQQYRTGPNGAAPTLLGTLGNLPGGLSEGAGGVNDQGIAVGASTRGTKYWHIPVTITDPEGRMRDLNKYIVNLPAKVVLTDNARINNRGQIAATGTDGKCYIVCPTEHCRKPAP